MLHRLALSAIIAASFLFIDRPARADGDVPPDPILCPALYAALCVIPGVCADVCGTYCDGIDSTDATLDCKVCIVTLAIDDYRTCVAALVPAAPTCAEQMPGVLPCLGGEVESGCYGDGTCDDPAASFCYACDPGGGGNCVTYCGAP